MSDSSGMNTPSTHESNANSLNPNHKFHSSYLSPYDPTVLSTGSDRGIPIRSHTIGVSPTVEGTSSHRYQDNQKTELERVKAELEFWKARCQVLENENYELKLAAAKRNTDLVSLTQELSSLSKKFCALTSEEPTLERGFSNLSQNDRMSQSTAATQDLTKSSKQLEEPSLNRDSKSEPLIVVDPNYFGQATQSLSKSKEKPEIIVVTEDDNSGQPVRTYTQCSLPRKNKKSSTNVSSTSGEYPSGGHARSDSFVQRSDSFMLDSTMKILPEHRRSELTPVKEDFKMQIDSIIEEKKHQSTFKFC